ncbi:GHMP family kinase ATP-binding protein [Vibrio spartinae]|uniref:L-threonine kinase n=1 Tax=Vibrio spartinae TaxID=1918945 RepID=A0ABX6R5V8_9VIBR|nr:kinase [Vibrio spartinae]QMV16712.1 L-threonine kinase [Vibrio spartinae]
MLPHQMVCLAQIPQATSDPLIDILSEPQNSSGLRDFGFGQSCCTFGELLQGMLPNGQDFLVTFPIHRYVKAKFYRGEDDMGLQVCPPHKTKALALADALLRRYQLPCTGLLEIESDIPESKGLASSSADLVAVARAITDHYHMHISDADLAHLLCQIEPTDAVMFGHCVAFHQNIGHLIADLGPLPPMVIVAHDEGGSVDTVTHQKTHPGMGIAEREQYQDLLQRIQRAVKHGDCDEIGHVTTMSSILNQRFRPNKHLSLFIDICDQYGGLGIAVAHSGTYIGILLDASDIKLTDKRTAIEDALKANNLAPETFWSSSTTRRLPHTAKK